MNPTPPPIPTETPDPSRRTPAWWPWIPNRVRQEPWRWLVVASGLQCVCSIATQSAGKALFGEPSPTPDLWLLVFLLGPFIMVGPFIACPVLLLRELKTPPGMLLLAGWVPPVMVLSNSHAVIALAGLVEVFFLSFSFVTWLTRSAFTAFWMTWLQCQLVLLVFFVLDGLQHGLDPS